MPVLPRVRNREQLNWSEFLAMNMIQQIEEIMTHPFRHPSLLLAILIYQCLGMQPPQSPIRPHEPLMKQWINAFPKNILDT